MAQVESAQSAQVELQYLNARRLFSVGSTHEERGLVLGAWCHFIFFYMLGHFLSGQIQVSFSHVYLAMQNGCRHFTLGDTEEHFSPLVMKARINPSSTYRNFFKTYSRTSRTAKMLLFPHPWLCLTEKPFPHASPCSVPRSTHWTELKKPDGLWSKVLQPREKYIPTL